MKTISIAKAQSNLKKILREVAIQHEPIHISGKGVLISEEDWNAIQETLFLLSIPKMRNSIKEGLQTPIHECSTELHW